MSDQLEVDMAAKKTWLRLYTETTRDAKLRRYDPVIRWIWITILIMGRMSPRPGYLCISEKSPATPTDIADEGAVSVDEVNRALAIFSEEHGMIELVDGVWHIINWHERQFESDYSTDRSIKSRLQRTCNNNATGLQRTCNGLPAFSETDSDTDNNTPPKNPESLNLLPPETGKPAGYPEDFLVFWQEYPRKQGANKRAAFQKWQVLFKLPKREQPTPGQLITAARNYAAEVAGTEQRYMKQAETFLSAQNRPYEAYITTEPVTAEPVEEKTSRQKWLEEQGRK